MFYILGKQYESPVYQDLHYACYRNGFPPFAGFTDDVGWGCTLRSFQMTITNALARIGTANPERFIRDDPKKAPFALQRFTSFGKKNYSVQPGKWYSPTVAAKLVLDCISSDYLSTYPLFPLNVVIHGSTSQPDFSRPVLLINPVRLGIDKLEKTYQHTLVDILNILVTLVWLVERKHPHIILSGFLQTKNLSTWTHTTSDIITTKTIHVAV